MAVFYARNYADHEGPWWFVGKLHPALEAARVFYNEHQHRHPEGREPAEFPMRAWGYYIDRWYAEPKAADGKTRLTLGFELLTMPYRFEDQADKGVDEAVASEIARDLEFALFKQKLRPDNWIDPRTPEGRASFFHDYLNQGAPAFRNIADYTIRLKYRVRHDRTMAGVMADLTLLPLESTEAAGRNED